MKKQFSNDMVPRKMPKGKTPTVATKRQQKVGSPVPKEPKVRKKSGCLASAWRSTLVTIEHSRHQCRAALPGRLR